MKGRKTRIALFSSDDDYESLAKEVNSFIEKVESRSREILDIDQTSATVILPDGKSDRSVRLTIMITYEE